jgi:hypothetical protein
MVWRVTVAGRVGTAMVGVLSAAVGVTVALGSTASGPAEVAGAAVFGAVFVIVGIVAPSLYAFRPRVCLDHGAVTVVNPLRTWVLPLDQVRPTVTAGYDGVTIVCLEAGQVRTINVWAVQKWNLSSWLGRQTRADRVAKEIATAAAQVQHGGPDLSRS